MTSLSLRRSVPGRRRTSSQTSTTTPLPLEDCSSRSIDLDTVFDHADDTGPADPKRPRVLEFPAASSSEGGMMVPVEPPGALPDVLEDVVDATVESVNRNARLDLEERHVRGTSIGTKDP